MTSTRRQRTKGKSLCLTDFFAQNERTDPSPQGSCPAVSPFSPTEEETATELTPASCQSPVRDPTGNMDGCGALDLAPSPNGLKRRPDAISDVGAKGARDPSSSRSSSATNSPAKHRTKLDAEPPSRQGPTATQDVEAQHTEDALGAFPTSNQAVSDSVLKEMMLALRASIQSSFTMAMNKQSAALYDSGGRVDHLENKMGEFSGAHNGLVDAHNQLEEEVASLSAKLADLEDRNRRNNVKLRGVPESVPPSELVPFIQQLIKTVLPQTSKPDLVLDRAHRLPKPKNLPASVPRDVIVRIHFFHIKEQLMQAARRSPHLPEPFHKVTLYADLSQHTIHARKKLSPITSILRQHKVLYKWGFPTKLIITKDGATHVVTSVESGSAVLRKLGLDPPSLAPILQPTPIVKLASEWRAAESSA